MSGSDSDLRFIHLSCISLSFHVHLELIELSSSEQLSLQHHHIQRG